MDIADTILYKKLKRIMVARLLILTVVLLAGAFFLEVNRHVFYDLIGVCYGLTAVYALLLKQRRALHALAFVQILVDLIFETVIIHYSGGLESVFAILYIISIFTACILFPVRGGLLTGVVASILYALLVVAEHVQVIPHYPTGLGLYGEPIAVFYLVYVRVTMFCVVGFLAGLFAARATQMEAHARQNERLSAMGELAANIAHEIRNPLASITGSVELLKEETEVQGESRRLMDLIIRETDRLQKFMEQYLDFVRSRPMERAPCDLVALLNEVIAVVRTNNQSRKDLTLGWGEGQREVLTVWADPVQMRQLFFNLVVNGVEAMPKGGHLTVRLSESDVGVTVSVQDQGDGIPKAKLKSVFEPFLTTKKKGTGLGLSIAQRIVESHGGRLSVRTSQGTGTTFSVDLPKHKLEARHEAA